MNFYEALHGFKNTQQLPSSNWKFSITFFREELAKNMEALTFLTDLSSSFPECVTFKSPLSRGFVSCQDAMEEYLKLLELSDNLWTICAKKWNFVLLILSAVLISSTDEQDAALHIKNIKITQAFSVKLSMLLRYNRTPSVTNPSCAPWFVCLQSLLAISFTYVHHLLEGESSDCPGGIRRWNAMSTGYQ